MMFMSLALHLQVLQVKEKEHHLNDAEVREKAQRLVFPPSSPINMS